jgi:hypothetical protein
VTSKQEPLQTRASSLTNAVFHSFVRPPGG